jgi:hypothetical protein
MKTLPYRATTGTGDQFDIEFILHPDTHNVVRVNQLITVVLEAINRDVTSMGETSNGDVLQALAMALAIRARMIHAPHETVEGLTRGLVKNALDAVADAERQSPRIGHA